MESAPYPLWAPSLTYVFPTILETRIVGKSGG